MRPGRWWLRKWGSAVTHSDRLVSPYETVLAYREKRRGSCLRWSVDGRYWGKTGFTRSDIGTSVMDPWYNGNLMLALFGNVCWEVVETCGG